VKVVMPTSINGALSMLAERKGDAIPIAGGTDLMVNWPERPTDHEHTYLDLSGLDELRAHHWTEESLVIGALTTYWDIVRDQQAAHEMRILIDAARTVGAVQIQSRGTWAGNIANASPAADGVLAMMALDAVVELSGVDGVEHVGLDEFYLGYKQTRRRPDQLITRIRIPRRPHAFLAFAKIGSRRAQAITKVGLAAARSDAGWRVVANSMAPTVRRCPAIEYLLEVQTPIDTPDGFRAAIRSDLTPIDDIRSTAAYRARVFANLLLSELRGQCPWIRPRGEPV
jgi:CO/xanthine dehydrogenase FAD-binding subunit